jgi:hypothetical protein
MQSRLRRGRRPDPRPVAFISEFWPDRPHHNIHITLRSERASRILTAQLELVNARTNDVM